MVKRVLQASSFQSVCKSIFQSVPCISHVQIKIVFCYGFVCILIYLKGLIYLLNGIKLMAQWPCKALRTCMGIQLMYIQHACKRCQVYSLDPLVYWSLSRFYKELVVLSRFQAAKFETYDQLACFQKLPKVETFIYLKITKTGNFLAVQQFCNLAAWVADIFPAFVLN